MKCDIQSLQTERGEVFLEQLLMLCQLVIFSKTTCSDFELPIVLVEYINGLTNKRVFIITYIRDR